LYKKYFYECPDWKAVSLAEIFHIVSVNVDESSFASPLIVCILVYTVLSFQFSSCWGFFLIAWLLGKNLAPAPPSPSPVLVVLNDEVTAFGKSLT